MIKKITQLCAFILCILSLLSFSACSPQSDNPSATTTPTVTEAPADIDPATVDHVVERWRVLELAFESTENYQMSREPVLDICQMDAVFTAPDGTEYTVPSFWDGENIWRVRFAPTQCGVWTYKTTCATDEALNNKTGKIGCNAYKGDLDIYKHGFVKNVTDTPYFMYDDGTPFFYLGDTHWAMSNEEFDSAGPYAGDIQTDSHFKYIVDKRVEQKFTVYQSQPSGASFNVANGFNRSDIKGFKNYDRYVQYIAEKGLVHTNAMFFFSTDIIYGGNAVYDSNGFNYDYLEKISRYWVARYSAYPIMWTMAQEVDNDFYYSRGDQTAFNSQTNPWKRVAEFTHKYDPYKHPLTAHMEGTGSEDGTDVVTSSFREIEGHSWYAMQTSFTKSPNFSMIKSCWNKSQGKVLVMYEGLYEGLWTGNTGARIQGWYAYLNGMFGYGYGAQDIWCYKNGYGTDKDSSDGFDTITIKDKQKKWSETINFIAPDQLTYMREFFESIEWWKLRPDFDLKERFDIARTALWACAADEDNTYVAYFYSKNKMTGKLVNMDADATYTIKWYNPRTNEYTELGTEFAPTNGSFDIPARPTSEDWVLLATKNK